MHVDVNELADAGCVYINVKLSVTFGYLTQVYKEIPFYFLPSLFFKTTSDIGEQKVKQIPSTLLCYETVLI